MKRGLVLASGSLARRRMLHNAGLRFTVAPADIPEPHIDTLPPAELAVALCLAKAHHVSRRFAHDVVVAADQVVVLPDGQVVGKPASRLKATQQLRAMAGRTHQLFSAAAVVWPGGEEVVADVAHVELHALRPADIQCALAWNEWQNSAGAYQVEGRSIHMVRQLRGCWHTVLGLPLLPLLQVLAPLGVTAWR